MAQETCYLCGETTSPFENRMHVQCDQREYAWSEIEFTPEESVEDNDSDVLYWPSLLEAHTDDISP
jgi:hypothetical protein